MRPKIQRLDQGAQKIRVQQAQAALGSEAVMESHGQSKTTPRIKDTLQFPQHPSAQLSKYGVSSKVYDPARVDR